MSPIVPPFRLVAEPLDEIAAKLQPFRWAGRDVGKRHKLGGDADFVNKSEYPYCECGSQMSFYGQFDSISSDFNLADCGVISVFVCFDCFETKSLLTSG
jgi:hypothetical protein